MAKDIEIELKLRLSNPNDVVEFLNKNAKFKYETKQHDIYFNAPHRDFLAAKDNVNEWLRIRLDSDRALITYKDWQPHDQKLKTHAIEYETGVDSYDQLAKIFRALNFIHLIDVKKLRRSWIYEDAEISLDEVEDLGSFIEIEYKGSLQDVSKAREYLTEMIGKLNAKTGALELRGYPYQMLAKKGLL